MKRVSAYCYNDKIFRVIESERYFLRSFPGGCFLWIDFSQSVEMAISGNIQEATQFHLFSTNKRWPLLSLRASHVAQSYSNATPFITRRSFSWHSIVPWVANCHWLFLSISWFCRDSNDYFNNWKRRLSCCCELKCFGNYDFDKVDIKINLTNLVLQGEFFLWSSYCVGTLHNDIFVFRFIFYV